MTYVRTCTRAALAGIALAGSLVFHSTAMTHSVAHADADTPGAVYTSTNAPGGNAVEVFNRAADGAITPAGVYPTGGTGTGAGLGSQSAREYHPVPKRVVPTIVIAVASPLGTTLITWPRCRWRPAKVAASITSSLPRVQCPLMSIVVRCSCEYRLHVDDAERVR